MHVYNFCLQVLHILVVQSKTSFQGWIRDPSLAFQEGEDLFENFIKRHTRFSLNSCNNAFASLRSAVSNPSVNHPYTGASKSYASWRLPCWCQSRAKLVALRNSQDLAC